MLGDWLYFETPDCNLVSLNIKDGTERWHKQICDLDQFYYGSVAPIVVKNHVIAGVSGDDLDVPGYIEVARSRDRRAAMALVRRAAEEGRPGLGDLAERRRDEARRRHDVAAGHLRSRAEPDLRHDRQSAAGHRAQATAPGANLFTASIVALNPDTGKMEWYFQSSPHDTHDWDATQTPVLFDGEINGQPRKLLAQAARNGHFFVLDRTNGKAHRLVRVREDELGERLRREGPADPESGEAAADRRRAGHAEPGRRDQLAAAELQPADRPVLRQRDPRLQRLLHLRPERQPAGLGRHRSRRLVGESMLQAIDYKTGKVKWSHKWEGRRACPACCAPPATCSSAARAVGRPRRAERDDRRCRSGTRGSAASVSNGAITYELDGTQYLWSARATRCGRSPCSTTTPGPQPSSLIRSKREVRDEETAPRDGRVGIVFCAALTLAAQAGERGQAPAGRGTQPAAPQGPRLKCSLSAAAAVHDYALQDKILMDIMARALPIDWTVVVQGG